ncbi:MAG: hypothetical protein DYG89_01790 [Caldilinea sp. CFX5]|nr:hypothetical protein [Caldilinea sp. CFX5]
MPRLELDLLGSPLIKLDQQPVTIAKQKAVALLAYLAVTRTHHRRDRLATIFWPGYDQSSARTYLRQALFELTQRLGEQWFSASRESIGLVRASELQVDVHLFLEQVAQASKWRDKFTATDYMKVQQAVELYRDDFLAGFTLPDAPDFDEWHFFQSEQLRQALAEALQQLIAWCKTQRAYPLAIDYARRWVNQDPLHEAAQRTLVELYAYAGQASAALHQYEECVRLLQKELGVPLDQETTALYEAIKRKRFPPPAVVSSSLSGNPPAAEHGQVVAQQPATLPVTNLPRFTSPLIGRATDLAALDRLLADANIRLITLVGPGGMGKTRLALAAAERQQQAAHFANGVYFVPLAPLAHRDAIIPAIADALTFSFVADSKETRTPKQQLLDYLRPKQILLVLDNFEHLLDGVELVLTILETAPAVRVLTTSRERLQVHDEQVYTVHGLSYPLGKLVNTDTPYAATELFCQRARRVEPDFALSAADHQSLTRICQLLEGMPLGIELAAAWVNVLPLPQIASEIEQSLDFLHTEARDLPQRHRSIRAVFDTTWQQLSTPEQTLFAQLSIFRGGFTRQAVQQVTGATLPMLSVLAAKALIQFDKPNDRYTVHELLRQYGASKLSEQPVQEQNVRNRHSAYYAGWLQQREPELKGAKQRDALTAIETEHENVRLAWQWALTQPTVDRIRQALDALCTFYEWQGRHDEGDISTQAAIATIEPLNTPEAQRLLAKALAWRTVFLRVKGPLDLAHQLLQRAATLLDALVGIGQDTRVEQAFIFLQTGHLALEQDNETAQSAYASSLALYRTLDMPWEAASALAGLGRIAQFRGAYHQVQVCYEESLLLYRQLGDHLGIATVLDALSLNARYQGKIEESEQLARKSYQHYQQIGSQSTLAKGLFTLGQAVDWTGKRAEAHALIQQALALYEHLGHRRELAALYARISSTELMLCRYTAAQAHAQMGLALAQEFGDLRFIGFALDNLSAVAFAEGRNAEAEQLASESLAAYQKLGVRAEEGRMYGGLAYFAWKRGDFARAKECFSQGLHIGLELPDSSSINNVLGVLSYILVVNNHVEKAVELDAFLQLDPQNANSDWYQQWNGRPIAAAAANLPPAAVAAAKARGQALDLWQTGALWLERLQSGEWLISAPHIDNQVV